MANASHPTSYRAAISRHKDLLDYTICEAGKPIGELGPRQRRLPSPADSHGRAVLVESRTHESSGWARKVLSRQRDRWARRICLGRKGLQFFWQFAHQEIDRRDRAYRAARRNVASIGRIGGVDVWAIMEPTTKDWPQRDRIVAEFSALDPDRAFGSLQSPELSIASSAYARWVASSGIASRPAQSTSPAALEITSVASSYKRLEFIVIGSNTSITSRLNSAGQFAFNALRLARVHRATPANPGAHSFT
jgi:hypothetical protein